MDFGRSLPHGRLAVFSVSTEEEAQKLITLSCAQNLQGDYVARELVEDQSMENLQLFSNKFARAHEILKQAGQCDCGEPGMYPIKTEKGPVVICGECGEDETECTYECPNCEEEYCVTTYGECPDC